MRNRIGLIALWSAMMAAALFFAAANVNSIYYRSWPLIGDTASYWLRDLSILDSGPPGGWLSHVWHFARDSARDPLRTLSFAVVGQKQTLSVSGHLYFSCFAAFFFLATLCACLWVRTRSAIYAISAPWAIFLALCFWDPTYGLPSRLPDMPAAFFFGASIFMLFIRRSTGSNAASFFASGALLGLATLTRFHTCMYGGLVIAPIVTIFAIDQYLKAGKTLRQFLVPHIAFMAGLGLFAGYFIIRSIAEVLHFYAIAGYGLNKTIAAALATTGKKLLLYTMGVPAISTLALLYVGFFALLWDVRKERDIADRAATLWASLSCIVLILFVLRVEDDISQSYYMLAGLFLLAMAPFRVLPAHQMSAVSQKNFSRYAFGLMLVLPTFAAASYVVYTSSETFRYPRPDFAKLHDFNHELTELVVANLPATSSNWVIDSNFDYYARFVIPMAQLRFKKHARFGNIFQIRQSQWQLRSGAPKDGSHGPWFSGVLEQDRELIMPALAESVNIFMVLTDVDNPKANDKIKDDFTREMARHVARRMTEDSATWEYRGKLNSPFGSDVLVYVNKTLTGS
ncbi:hypothetical protein [Tardiphaga sp. 862_B3_N1_1]|uniref:hypothetical protein n=1 Tax=Tardiphaga sp. 862_B3_N1_1 TaxID=3240763 RepID=UPI003F8B0EB2